MVLLIAAVLILVLSGLTAVATASRKGARFASAVGVTGAILGATSAVLSAIQMMVTGRDWEAWTAWRPPMGTMHAGMDHLSALFVILISVVGAIAAVYGRGYLSGHHENAGRAGRSWCWYNLLMAAMICVVTARDGFSFLMAWEAMSLTSFFLVLFDHERAGVTRAGWIYLVTTHVGAAFLFVMFMLLGNGTTLDFSSIIANGAIPADPALKTVIFVLAVVGFGTKAGFFPVHVWLPEAHPAAPSHVSAVMSGVMIKTGIYGLLRVMTMLGQPAPWWGWTLIAIGAVSGIGGVLFALAQHDLKRLLAYSSIENVGIITLGLGIGVLGAAGGNTAMTTLGFAGALLHTVNHGLFKSLLFMGAGSVLHGARTLQIDRLGGLMKSMPATGTLFVIGAVAICGLPPLNGFVGEFLIYSGAFIGMTADMAPWMGALAIISLAIIGGLAVATFTKAVGVVFLGEARSPEASLAGESSRWMTVPMGVLAVLCAAAAIGAPWLIRILLPAAAVVVPIVNSAGIPIVTSRLIMTLTLTSGAFVVTLLLITSLRGMLLRGRPQAETGTWDCGYAGQSTRVQYTASSFADPTLRMFRPLLRTERELVSPDGLFPARSSIRTVTADVFMRFVYEPAVTALARAAGLVQALQQGRTHLYLLYIFLTIIVLMIWNLRK